MTLRHMRIREEPSGEGGFRVLVDRLWPRGVSKEDAGVDLWAKSLTPSSELRTWYHADKDARREDFRKRYRAELDEAYGSGELTEQLEELAGHRDTVLLTDSKDIPTSHVPVLEEWLETMLEENAE